MIRVMLIEDRDSVAELLVERLNASAAVELCQRAPQLEDGFGGHLSGGYASFLEEQAIDTVVYSPPVRRRHLDLKDAESVFRQCAKANIDRFVLLSSAMVYGASPHNQGLMPETRAVLSGGGNRIASDWNKLEAMAVAYLGEASRTSARLTVLRLAAMPAPDGKDYFSQLFRSPIAVTLPGHDPTMQLLSREDLATAVSNALETSQGGVYNVAPNETITLRAALKLAGVRRFPVSRLLQRVARPLLNRMGLAH